MNANGDRVKHVQVPATLWAICRDAIREAERDSRPTEDGNDRALHDSTRKKLREANDGIRDWQDAKIDGRNS